MGEARGVRQQAVLRSGREEVVYSDPGLGLRIAMELCICITGEGELDLLWRAAGQSCDRDSLSAGDARDGAEQ